MRKDHARVLRGGSWRWYPGYAGAAYRDYNDPDSRDYDFGFRLVRVSPIL